MDKEEPKICALCKKPISKGTGFWFHRNPFGIKYAHQSCYYEYYDLGKSIVGRNKK